MGNVLMDAIVAEASWENMVSEWGYKRKTTFYSDFTIADAYGDDAIKDTYNRSEDWLNNLEYGTELVMVLNHKSWEWASKNEKRCYLYISLYEKAYDLLLEKHKDEAEQSYIFKTLD